MEATRSVEQSLHERFRRVAVTHEWLTIPGGSEKVVVELLGLFPQAELFTSVYDPEPWPAAITQRTVHTSFLDRLPGARRRYQQLLPLMNAAFESFDLTDFDLVISSNHACAKNVLTRPETLHACYCYTPMRYAWDPRGLRGEPIPRLLKPLMPALVARLRRQDLLAAARPDHFIAISNAVAARIRKYYRRDAAVIHPPVDVHRFLSVGRSADDYYLSVGRLVPYKRVDLAIAACSRLGRRLKVVGEGRAFAELQRMAGPKVEFLGGVPDDRLPELLAGARALLFPGEEDFGITPVEAQAAGVPVIALGKGGVRDTVIDGETGLLYQGGGESDLREAILRFEGMDFDDASIRSNAHRFSKERFRQRLAELLTEASGER